MKNIFKLATLLFSLATLSFVGCVDPIEEGFVGTDELSAKVETTAASTATLTVNTVGLSRIAWIAQRTDDGSSNKAPMPILIFKNGSQMKVSDGKHTVTVKNLTPNATYTVYIVGEIASSGDVMDEAIAVTDIQTVDFAEDFKVRDIDYRGFTIDVKVPESVKEDDHMIKWAASDLFLYNKNRYNAKGMMPDAELLVLNDKAYGQFFFNESTTLVLNEAESFSKNPDGTPNYEGGTYLYETIVPGQPEVVIMGEHNFSQSPFGWGWGYYDALFDSGAWASAVAKNDGEPVDEAPFWEGLYYHEVIQVKKPVKLDDSMMDFTIDRSTDDAVITVTVHDRSIVNVCIMVLDDEQHAVAYRNLGNTYDHFQWFATSMVGMMEGASASYDPFGVDPVTKKPRNGVIKTALSEYLINVSQTSHYWVYAVGLRGDIEGDGWLDGHEQICKHDDFDLIATTKPAPTLVVEALEPTKPNTAVFRVTCPSAAEGNGATKGWYTSNYEKDWLSAGMTPQELIDAYSITDPYFTLSALDLDKINSPEGLTLEFKSRPNENYHFAAMIKNDEGTPCYSDKVVCRTLEAPVERVESDYFEVLNGEWTATATIKYKKLRDGVDTEDETLTEEDLYEEKTTSTSCIITIGDAEYPEVLPQSVYDLYAQLGKDPETVDGYYADLTAAIDEFNELNRNQNRILMNGFNFAGEMLPYLPYFNFQSAYDLFTALDYNALTNAMPVYDFGPKWFLEVKADGTLAVPFNSDYFYPMASWYQDSFQGLQEVYLLAYEPGSKMAAGYLTGADENGYAKAETGYFPVEVSEDGNTITIKPYVTNNISFYPNAGVYAGIDPTTYAPSYNMSIGIISDIVLTRGATQGAPRVAAQAAASVEAPVMQSVESINEIRTSVRPRKRSNFNVGGVTLVGPDHSLTPEQRAQQWLEMRRNALK